MNESGGAGVHTDSFRQLEALTAKLPLFAVLDRNQGGVEEYRVESGTCIRFSLYTYGGLVSVDRFLLLPGTVFGEHVHTGEVQVLFIYLGTAEITIDGKKSMLTPGDSVVIPADVVHNIRAESEVRCISICYPAGRYSAKGVPQ